jgi:hypothetical protein
VDEEAVRKGNQILRSNRGDKTISDEEVSKILDKHDRVMRFVEDEFIHQLLRQK